MLYKGHNVMVIKNILTCTKLFGSSLRRNVLTAVYNRPRSTSFHNKSEAVFLNPNSPMIGPGLAFSDRPPT